MKLRNQDSQKYEVYAASRQVPHATSFCNTTSDFLIRLQVKSVRRNSGPDVWNSLTKSAPPVLSDSKTFVKKCHLTSQQSRYYNFQTQTLLRGYLLSKITNRALRRYKVTLNHGHHKYEKIKPH